MKKRFQSARGFSMLEVLVALGIAGVIAAVAMPVGSRTANDLRLGSDARAIHNMVSLAKMRAGTRYSRVRFYFDQSSETFFLQFWDKTAAEWKTDGTVARLSGSVDFGYGSLATPPPNTQSSLHQAPPCKANNGTDDITNTSCVVFNPRGIPIDPTTGDPYGDTGFYVTDKTGVYGVTLSATPLVRLWWSKASSAAWVHK